MGISNQSKYATLHTSVLPNGPSKAYKSVVRASAETCTHDIASSENESAMSIIHLGPETDYKATYTTVNHNLHVIDESVGIAAFHQETGQGGIATGKALKNNYKDSCKFLRFLRHDPLTRQKEEPALVDLGNHGLSWYDPEKHQGGTYDGPHTIFRKVTFSYDNQLKLSASGLRENCAGNAPHLRSEHLIHFRCGALKSRHCFSTYARSPITIVSGVCLFTSAILNDIRNLNDDQMQSEEFEVRQKASHSTLQATEAMCRLSRTTADTISMLRQTLSEIAATKSSETTCEPAILVKLDVARLAYYDVAREMLARHKWTFTSAKLWLDIVDRRHDTLFDDFSSMIVDTLRQTGSDSSMIRIYASSGSSAAEQAFRSAVREHRLPDTKICLGDLGRDVSNSWLDFFNFMQVSEEQQSGLTIQDLARFTYPYELLEPILDHNDLTSPKLVIMIDDPFEWRIFNTATKALDRYYRACPELQHLVMGAFPFPRIISTPNKNLYYYDCRRQYRASTDDQTLSHIDGASPQDEVYMNTSELVRLARRLSVVSSPEDSVEYPA